MTGFAFAIHPLAPWQRRLLGVRHRDPRLLGGRHTDRVRAFGRLRVETSLGHVEGVLIDVPDLPDALVADQIRALALQRQAATVAAAAGASVIGLGSALAVVAGRGRALDGETDLAVTTGQAATAWTCAALTRQVLGDEPVGILGATGTVGAAVARALTGASRVLAVARGRTASHLEAHGVEVTDEATLLRTCRVVVGARTTGPTLSPGALHPGTVLIDLANPPSLHPGPLPPGVVVLAGETLAWPGRIGGDGWGRIWRRLAGYEGGSAYACLVEPLAVAALGEGPWSTGRSLDPDAVDAAGAALTRLGFRPRLHARRTPRWA